MLDSGVWLLPSSPALEEAFAVVLARIEELGGKPRVFRATDFSEEQSDQLKDAFNKLRVEEYNELSQRCDRFLAHVQLWTDERDFRFGAIEELEEDLEKRRRTLMQIASRDVFGLGAREQLEKQIKRCEEALAGFVEQVFAAVDGKAASDPA